MTTVDLIKDEHYVYPSTLFVSKESYSIKTVLGSCVSVCLFDPYASVGGLNHYMLPAWTGQGLATPKYGNVAIDLLIEQLAALGAAKNRLIAKVFGGAELAEIGNIYAIGRRNVELAKQQLDKHAIPIVSSSTGGSQGRMIVFQTDTGVVHLKHLQAQAVH